ncbi:MAG: hypothetical protein KA764_14250 [Anaerolineales bacterium]|nr:hypothetical protein [Anaerolineales bacterium]
MLAELLSTNARPWPTAEHVGTKAAVLGQLLEAGFPVPAGLVVPTAVFQRALAPYREPVRAALHSADWRDPAAAQAVAQQVQMLLAELALPARVREALQQALPSLGDGPLAVRSSATHEDWPAVSFAGHYHTRLGVRGTADIEAAILACWRSLFSPAALAAQARLALPDADPAMAVLIQPLLAAECAGVCFSVDPVQQRPESLLIAATWGLGEGLVAGSVPADTARLRRTDLEIEAVTPALKVECIQLDPAGGTRRVAVPAHQQRPACLPEAWLQAVARFGLALEQWLGRPQDVEWAIVDGQVWILQSRPITTLALELIEAAHFPVEWADERERRAFWHTAGLPSHAPGALLLPAEIDYTKARFEGGDAAVAQGGGDRTYWRKYVNGRFYWAAAESPVGPADRRIRSAALEDLFERLERQDITLWEHWGPEVIRAAERLAAFDAPAAAGPALADHLEDTLAAARRHWMIHTLSPRKRLGRLAEAYQSLTGASRDAAEQALSQLLEGEDTVQTRLIDDVYGLARLARAVTEVAALFAERPPDLYARLKALPAAAPFVQRFEQFLAAYGDRPCPGDPATTILATLPWRENPEWVLDMVAAYLPPPGEAARETPAAARLRARQQRDHLVESLCASADSPHLAAEFRRRLAYARRAATFLDDHHHYIDQLADGQFYQALLHAGRWLAARGDLARPDEVAWLEVAEILTALRAPGPRPLFATLAERQRVYANWRQLLAPAVLGLPPAALPARAADESAGEAAAPDQAEVRANRLAGQGVSPGRASGRARLVLHSAALPDVRPGDILVAADAGTLWTPLFPALAGVVLDTGHVGQHAAITAREFGLPAVFGTQAATRRIPDGAWVSLDGAHGTVEWSLVPRPPDADGLSSLV